MQGEFRMITDLATVTPKELLFNYDELKAFLTEALQEYNTLIVTEDAISDAKAKRATLNKLADNINSYRINVKKQLMQQYDADFKPKCDELVAMTKDASDNIAKQIKAFGEAEAKRKLEAIRLRYEEMADEDMWRFCPWGYVFNPKWENKGVTEDAAVSEITEEMEKVRGDISAIREMGGEDTAALLARYVVTHNISDVIHYASELKTEREREAARKLEAEEKKRIATASATPRNDEDAARRSEYSNAAVGFKDSEMVTVNFRVTCTKAQLAALGEYMRKNGIQFGRS